MPVYVQKKEDDSYVIVDQIDNLPNHCANCCHPVPGDEIVTFTTRGYGLAIHRADCPNYLRDLSLGIKLETLMPQYPKEARKSYSVSHL